MSSRIPNTMTDEQWLRVLSSMPLAVALARAWVERHPWCGVSPRELATDVGVPCLMRCSELYDGKNPWSSYVRVALTREYNRPASKCVCVELDDDVGVEDHDETTPGDSVLYLMKGLSEYERSLLLMRYWGGMTVQEVADACGVSKATAWRALDRALKRCRDKARTV